MQTKQCKKCLENLSINLFSKNKTKNDGFCNFCKKCHKEYHHIHYTNNKEYYKKKSKKQKKSLKHKYVGFKSQLKCSKCDENHIACLEFHHLNPEEKYDNLSNMFLHGASKEKIEKELKKCIILCSNCHRKLHYD